MAKLDDSVTRWLHELKRGNRDAARELWERYAHRMNQVGRGRLRHARHGGFDEEDVTLSAFENFCRAVRGGRYQDLEGGESLWQILATFTLRKANDRLKGETAEKRGGNDRESTGTRTFLGGGDSRLEKLPTRETGPETAAIIADECSRLFMILDDPDLETLVLLKLDGFTNDEAAEQLGYTRRTIQRMLNNVREVWTTEQQTSKFAT